MSEQSTHEDEAPGTGAHGADQAPTERQAPLALEAAELDAALGLDAETLRLLASTGC